MNDRMLEAVDAEILLVEDDPGDAELVQRALAKAGITPPSLWLKDGAEALDFLFHKGRYAHRVGAAKPKLVILDIMLPRISGIEVLRSIKSDPQVREVPVVMLTSSAEDRDLHQCYALGVNSYIVKPMDFSDFTRVVREVGLYWMLTNKVCRQ